MAEYLPKFLGEELTCHICTDIYTDPVQMPCQHSFCRECLKAYVSSDATEDDSKYVDSSGVEVEVVTGGSDAAVEPPAKAVYCPICRTVSELDTDGISMLPIHFTIANILEKYKTEMIKYGGGSTEIRNEDTGPKCSLCEGDQTKTAVKGCLTCKSLYCPDCLLFCHPMRGSLSKHTLVGAVDYAVFPMCEEHDEPLKVFCGDCKHLYCYPCSVQNHAKHDIKDANVAYDEEKGRLTAKIDQLKKVYDGISSCILELSKRQKAVTQCFVNDYQTIETKYHRILAVLEKWRSDSSRIIDERHDSLTDQMDRETSRLQQQLTEIDNYLEGKEDYFDSSDAIQYLMSSEETIESLSSRISGTESTWESYISWQRDIKKAEDDQPLAREVISLASKQVNEMLVCKKDDGSLEYIFGEQTLLCPVFSMKNGLHQNVSVQDNGRLVVGRSYCSKNSGSRFLGCLANCAYKRGRLYWEMDVTYAAKVLLDKATLVYSAGLVHQSKSLPHIIGMNKHSWSVDITLDSPCYFECWHGKTRYSRWPAYLEGTTLCRTDRLGFYVDCVQRTFTMLDCTHNHVLHTYRDIDLSVALTPAVALHNFKLVDASVRLRTGQDISALPTCLRNMLPRH